MEHWQKLLNTENHQANSTGGAIAPNPSACFINTGAPNSLIGDMGGAVRSDGAATDGLATDGAAIDWAATEYRWSGNGWSPFLGLFRLRQNSIAPMINARP